MVVDIMEIPLTESDNGVAVIQDVFQDVFQAVFQDSLSKWPLVFPVLDQKAERLACFLVKEEFIVSLNDRCLQIAGN